jgi:hypothetical protein
MGPVGRISGYPGPGPRRGPRAGRRDSVWIAAQEIPPPLEVAVGKTIRIPLGQGKIARVQVVGLDALEAIKDLEHEAFASTDVRVFTCTFAPETGLAFLTPTGVGTASLGVKADAYIGEGEILLTDVFTVEVYPIATQLRLYYQPAGAAREVLLPAGGGVIDLRLGSTATVRVEGIDDMGNVVPLQSQAFSTLSDKFHIDPASPPEAGKAVLVPDALTGFLENILIVTADGDPSANKVVTLEVDVLVRVLESQATHLGMTYTLQNRPGSGS